MSNRRRKARDQLEIYLVHFFLSYRPMILIAGVILLLYAIVMLFINPIAGSAGFLPAVFLLLLSNSYNFTLYTARLGAWIGTLWRDND